MIRSTIHGFIIHTDRQGQRWHLIGWAANAQSKEIAINFNRTEVSPKGCRRVRNLEALGVDYAGNSYPLKRLVKKYGMYFDRRTTDEGVTVHNALMPLSRVRDMATKYWWMFFDPMVLRSKDGGAISVVIPSDVRLSEVH
jgi:hypothetical protein